MYKIKYYIQGGKMEYQVGDIVRTKKTHPCGSKLWEITRVGVDFKLKCLGCGHIIMLERPKALKIITKKVLNYGKPNIVAFLFVICKY